MVSSVLGLASALILIFGLNPWYKGLEKPFFAPNLYIMAPVHFVALVLAGFGVQVVMGNVSGNPAVKPARRVFSIWLLFHGIWMLIFAGLHFPVLGLGASVVQWGMAVIAIQKFYNVDPSAGHRTLPFFVVTSFWMVINFYILSMNNL